MYKSIFYEIHENCKNKKVFKYLDRGDALPILDLGDNVWFYDKFESYNYEIPNFVHIWLEKYIKKHYGAKFFLEDEEKRFYTVPEELSK